MPQEEWRDPHNVVATTDFWESFRVHSSITKKELKIPSVSSYMWCKKTEIQTDFSDILFLNSRITKWILSVCMEMMISGKGHKYYPNNKLMLHSDLFIIGTQVSQFDLPRVSIICILLNLSGISTCSPLSPHTPPSRGLASQHWKELQYPRWAVFNIPAPRLQSQRFLCIKHHSKGPSLSFKPQPKAPSRAFYLWLISSFTLP